MSLSCFHGSGINGHSWTSTSARGQTAAPSVAQLWCALACLGGLKHTHVAHVLVLLPGTDSKDPATVPPAGIIRRICVVRKSAKPIQRHLTPDQTPPDSLSWEHYEVNTRRPLAFSCVYYKYNQAFTPSATFRTSPFRLLRTAVIRRCASLH